MQSVGRENMAEMACTEDGVPVDKFIKFLTEVGYKVPSHHTYNWLLDNKPTKELFQWLCENVNSSNYLSSEELKEYEEIKSSGKLLEGDELENELKSVIPNYEDLKDNGTDNLNDLREELSDAESYKEKLASLKSTLSNEILRKNAKAKVLEERNISLQQKNVKLHQQCFGRNLALESAWNELVENIKNVLNYGSTNQKLRFMGELPIEPYSNEIAAFERNVNSYLELNMTISEHQKSSSTIKIAWDMEMEKLRSGFQSTRLRRLRADAESKGLESACDFVRRLLKNKGLNVLASNPRNIGTMLLEMRKRIKNLEQELGYNESVVQHTIRSDGPCSGSCWHRVHECVKSFAWYRCCQLDLIQKQGVLYEKSTSLLALKNVVKLLLSQAVIDIIWMMILGAEISQILSITGLISSGIDYLKSEQIGIYQRMEQMRINKELRDQEIERIEYWPIMDSLLNCLKSKHKTDDYDHSHISLLSSFHLFSTPATDFKNILKTLVKYSEDWNSDIKKLEYFLEDQIGQMFSLLNLRWKEISRLRSKLFSSTTPSKAVVLSVNQLMFLNQSHEEIEIDGLGNKLKKLKKKYEMEKMSSSKMDSILKMLWVKFLTNPKEVSDFILISREKDTIIDKSI